MTTINNINIIQNKIHNKKNKDNKKNKEKIKNILKLFPYFKNNLNAYRLKIDKKSLYYISKRETSDIITKIIKEHSKEINLNPKNIIITDATAGVGGNTISFAMNFNIVNAIEIDKIRCSYLKNNINVYGLTNTIIYNEDCNNILNYINSQHIVFIDPPWGGKLYKIHKTLRISIGGKPIEMICNDLTDYTKTICPPKLVVFKLPKNYDINYFNKYTNNNKIFIHNLKKMIILVVYCIN